MPLIYRLILHNTKALCFLKWHPCEKLNQSSKNDCFLPRKTQMFFIFCHVLYFNILKTLKKFNNLRSIKRFRHFTSLQPKRFSSSGKERDVRLCTKDIECRFWLKIMLFRGHPLQRFWRNMFKEQKKMLGMLTFGC